MRMSSREPLAELLEFATQVAFDAGRITLRYVQTSLDVETKSDVISSILGMITSKPNPD